MSLRYGLLGLLAEGSASGYDLSRRFQETIGAVWPASHPQIYTELVKLADEGLITASSVGARGRKEYSITPQGIDAVKKWLTNNNVDHTLRSETLFRSFFFWLMEPAMLEKHLMAEKAFFEARVAQYKQFADAKDRGELGSTPQVESARVTLEAGIRLYQSLADWADWAQRRQESTVREKS